MILYGLMSLFRETEDDFFKLLSQYETENKLRQELFKIEMDNLPIYGYGIKGFMLSMLECAYKVSNNQVSAEICERIISMGKEMLEKPVELLEGVEETLEAVSKTHKILLITKGDLLDQERKLEKSGLSKYFHHVEVLSNKHASNYKELLEHLEIHPDEFLMIGNSLKSDVLPLLEIGASAIHIPFHTTWEHEMVEPPKNVKYETLSVLTDLKKLLGIS